MGYPEAPASLEEKDWDKSDTDNKVVSDSIPQVDDSPVQFRLYKKRFVGCIAMCLLNGVCGMNGMWFSAIAVDTAHEFDLSYNQVNWLSNNINLVYLPTAFIVPWVVSNRFGIRKSCILASACLVVASWLRYAGTAKGLPPGGAYALLFIGQILVGCSQPWFQVLAPKYSEVWFGLRGRVSATMSISLMMPLGSALAQLLSPLLGTPRASILIIGIITTAIAPVAFLIKENPPLPPTHAGSIKSPPAMETLRSVLGYSRLDDTVARLTRQEQIDFAIMIWGFGILVGVTSAFGTLVAEVYAPYGYDATASGLLGSALLISGLVGAVITAPLFDRVLTHHLALTLKCVVPFIAGAWLSLVWAVGHGGLAPSYVVLCTAGFGSLLLLPVVLELACEVTRNAELSSSALWFSGNAFTVVFVLVSDPLRAGPNANPPLNMKKQMILHAAFALSVLPLLSLLKGRQRRREMDEQFAARADADAELVKRPASIAH